jgi:acetolactate synthase-1/2/3 large subunit
VNSNRTYIQIDVDPAEVGRNLRPTIGIVGDAKLALRELVERLARHNERRPSRRGELVAIKRRAEADLDAVQPQSSYARAIRHELPDDGILIADFTQVGYWSYAGYPVYEPRTFVTPGYQGTLGYGFPTALGAKVGNPNRKVIAMSGDGGFMFNVQELSSMVRHKIAAVSVVFDDGAYGNVRRTQRQSFAGHTIASELTNPDFVKLAEAFGVRGMRADSTEGLQVSIREALKADEPALIVVPVAEMPNMFHLMRGRQAITPPPVAAR